jgi:hypothetical protein
MDGITRTTVVRTVVTLALAAAAAMPAFSLATSSGDDAVSGAPSARTSLNPQPEPPGATGPDLASVDRYCLDCEPNLPG